MSAVHFAARDSWRLCDFLNLKILIKYLEWATVACPTKIQEVPKYQVKYASWLGSRLPGLSEEISHWIDVRIR